MVDICGHERDDEPPLDSQEPTALCVSRLSLPRQVMRSVVFDDHLQLWIHEVTSSDEPAVPIENLHLGHRSRETRLDDDGPGYRFPG